MTDAWNGVPLHPECDGNHMMEWIDEHGRVWHEVWKWSAQTAPPVWLRPNFTGGPYGYEPHHLTAPIYNNIRYLGPCLTPAEVVAREAAIIEDENRNPWKMAVINAMVCWEMLPHENETPCEVLNRLLTFEQMVALDPAVSSDAAKQINAAYKRGQEDMRERAAHCATIWGQGKAGVAASRQIESEIRALPIKEARDE